ncbi:MAG: HNH endonuclease [Caldilineaceae bacterium]|nr:HNH endonuclease [Caldilineaceae bacterium]MCB9137868.1 HNH endonuclease [Caldilineaceae bacterium]
MPPLELDLIRQRYNYACGYCGVSEVSAGGVLTVDHYRPLSAGGGDELDNLVYACVRCNQYKHSYWPTADDERLGFRVLHPLLDSLSTHYRLVVASGRFDPLSKIGHFHVTLLRLNRPQLVQHRLKEQMRKLLEGKLTMLEQQVREMEQTISAQERYISALEARLGLGPVSPTRR